MKYTAEYIEAVEEKYTSAFTVFGIYFGNGDPENGGQHWNFTRALGDDDDGVCTVKEIQQVTIYGAISEFRLSRNMLFCKFVAEAYNETGERELHIDFEIDDEKWNKLADTAKKIFTGETYFKLLM